MNRKKVSYAHVDEEPQTVKTFHLSEVLISWKIAQQLPNMHEPLSEGLVGVFRKGVVFSA